MWISAVPHYGHKLVTVCCVARLVPHCQIPSQVLLAPLGRLSSEHTPLWETQWIKDCGITPSNKHANCFLLKNGFMVLFLYWFGSNSHIHQKRTLTACWNSQEQLSPANTADVTVLHNCLSVLGMFNTFTFRQILTVYICFTAAVDLTVAGNSPADLFICCTPAVFSKVLLPQSFQAVQYNLPQSTFLFSFLPSNSPKVQGTYFST